MDDNKKIDRLCGRLDECTRFYKSSLPLCAAENVISDFCKIPLSGDFQERYIMGSPYDYRTEGNFIGSQLLLPFYTMIHEECELLFGSCYSDARTLSGMNCLTTVLMSLTNLNEKIAILPAEWGGHPSVQPVCERLGLVVYKLPYDVSNWDIDYDSANALIASENIKFILLAPSDIIHAPAVEKLDLDKRILLYDISQLMGLMAGSTIPCPINLKNTVLFGGTHKTLPGPASGLILTNDEALHNQMETAINPKFLRHTQMHQVISLLFALLEMECFGRDYTKAIVHTSNELGKNLAERGFDVANLKEKYSETHQIFLHCDYREMIQINENAIRYGITLNKKEKNLFSNCGIRLGTQEIARYGWEQDTIAVIGEILSELRKPNADKARIAVLKENLPPKILRYTFDEDTVKKVIATIQK